MKNEGQRPLGVAVIGCGYWGGNYLRVFREIPGTLSVAVCDRRAERLRFFQDRYPDIFTTEDVDELLARENVDAVVICTEAKGHYEAARKCLEAGKHVLVEKPMTTDSNQAWQLTLLAEEEGLTLMVGYTFIYNAAVRKVKEYVQSSADDIYYLHARRTNLGPIRSDVNALWDLATHDIAIFNYLLDSAPEWVSAVGARVLKNGHEDLGFISLGYPRGIIGHIHVSWADPDKAREVVVVCADRRILFDDLSGGEQVRVFEKGIRSVEAEPAGFGEYRLQIRDGDIISPKIEASEPLKNQCRHFVECIQTGQRPITSGWSGLDGVRTMNAVDESVALRGARIEVNGNGHNVKRATAGSIR